MPMLTQKDIAREAGVSTASVSLFLNQKPGVSKQVQDNIAAAIARLGYQPRQPKKKNSKLIGIIIENLGFSAFSDLLYLQVMQGFEEEARDLGFHCVISSINTSGNLEIPEAIISGDFAGVVALGGGAARPAPSRGCASARGCAGPAPS